MHYKGFVMSEIERCPNCYGRKRILGLGMIEKECNECKGIGHVKKQEVIARYNIKEDDQGVCELVTPEPKVIAKIKNPYKRTKKAKQ